MRATDQIQENRDSGSRCIKSSKKGVIEMHKCRGCLCKSCINICGCRKCNINDQPIKSCGLYNKFEQMEIFPKATRQRLPRFMTWNDYGISKSRYKKLKALCQRKEYDALTQSAAYATNPEIAEYILFSVKKNMSYDALEVKWELREVEQMPCCRTDFYGYRRLFYHNLDSILREKNGTNEITTKECTAWH